MNTDSSRGETDGSRKRIKWEPLALFIAVTAIGVALVAGGERSNVRIGPVRGYLEQSSQTPTTYQIRYRNGESTGWLTPAAMSEFLGEENVAEIARQHDNPVFQFFNITSWWALAWVGVGLLGQTIFMGRMAVQWIISERRRESVVPPVFWYLSLTGGVMLFTYFVWRQDIVGVLGQTSGVAIYARNIRLIHKRRRKDAAALEGPTTG